MKLPKTPIFSNTSMSNEMPLTQLMQLGSNAHSGQTKGGPHQNSTGRFGMKKLPLGLQSSSGS
jgi:hypothetical protein